ncbi:MAG: hypothetical protein IJE84_05560, partial [Clostridia bacterium]|nr:hypothetical protein [Clostridia bacterium]
MSSNNRGADNQKKSTKDTRQQRIVRAVCLFLAILMILSCVSVLAYVFGSSLNVAADSDYGFPNNLIAVGLECGTSEVAVGFELSTTNGFVVNEAVIGRDERSSTRIYTLTEEDVFIACDVNLSKSSGKYTKYDGNKAAVGGYHIQITEKMVDSGDIKVPQKLDITSETQLRDLIAEIDSLVNGTSYNAIPCYIDNKYEVRIGDFSSADNAQKGIEKLTELSKLYNVKVVEPSATAVSIIEPNLNKVLFEYDCYS